MFEGLRTGLGARASRASHERLQTPLVAILFSLACGDQSAVVPAQAAAVSGLEASSTARWRFGDGSWLERVRVSEAEIHPGRSLHVALDCHIPPESDAALYLTLMPSQTQAERHIPGPGLRRPQRTDDGRTHWLKVESCSVDTAIEIPVHPSWRSATGVLVAVFADEAALSARVPQAPYLHVLEGPADAWPVDGVRSEVRGSPNRALLDLLKLAPLVADAPQTESITIDGQLNEPIWQRPGMPMSASLDGEPVLGGQGVFRSLPPGRGQTDVWWAWDIDHLYVAARLDDHDVFVPHEQRDDPLYRDECFEVFIGSASGPAYVELQVAANNIKFDAAFSRHRQGGPGWDGAWVSAVALEGSLNDKTDNDRGWTVELAVPWAELCPKLPSLCQPQPGLKLRLNSFRLEKPRRRGQLGMGIAPTRVPDFHAMKAGFLVTLAAERTDVNGQEGP